MQALIGQIHDNPQKGIILTFSYIKLIEIYKQQSNLYLIK